MSAAEFAIVFVKYVKKKQENGLPAVIGSMSEIRRTIISWITSSLNQLKWTNVVECFLFNRPTKEKRLARSVKTVLFLVITLQ